MQQQYLKLNQHSAVKDLEAALRRVVGVDDALLATVRNHDLEQDLQSQSACEAILERQNNDFPLTQHVNHYGCYRASGSA
jgi:hypothetical protein